MRRLHGAGTCGVPQLAAGPQHGPLVGAYVVERDQRRADDRRRVGNARLELCRECSQARLDGADEHRIAAGEDASAEDDLDALPEQTEPLQRGPCERHDLPCEPVDDLGRDRVVAGRAKEQGSQLDQAASVDVLQMQRLRQLERCL